MSAQPNETPQDSIRNGMQLLTVGQHVRNGWWYSEDDMAAIWSRLEDALAKLEGPNPNKESR